MRRTTRITGIILIAYILLMAIVQYSMSVDAYFIEQTSTNIQITKPATTSSTRFINSIDQLAQDNGISFVIKQFTYDEDSDLISTNYYLSTNYQLNNYIFSDETIQDNYNLKNLDVPNLIINYQLKPLTDFITDQINYQDITIQVHGEEQNINQFATDIAKSYVISEQNSKGYVSNISIIPVIVIFAIFITSLLLDQKNKLKEYNIKRLIGFRKSLLLREQFIKCLIAIGIIFGSLWLISLIIYPKLLTMITSYLFFSITYTLPYIIVILITALIINLIFVSKQLNYQYIKNYKSLFGEKFFLFILKLSALVFVTIFIASSINTIHKIGLEIKQSEIYEEQFTDYVTLPVNLSGKVISDDIFNRVANFENEIYQVTIEQNHGLLLNSDNIINNESEIPVFYTNANYLDFSNIVSENKNLTKADLEANDVVILYPNNMSTDEIDIANITDATDFSYLTYDNGQSFPTYNAKINNSNVTNPIIVIENELDSNFVGTVLDYYYVQDTQIEEVLDEYDTNNFVMKPEKVTDGIKIQLRETYLSLLESLIMLIIAIFFLTILIIYTLSVYLSENKQEIFIHRITGYRFKSIHKRYYRLVFLQYLITAAFLLAISANTQLFVILLLILLIELLTSLIIIKKQEMRSYANPIN